MEGERTKRSYHGLALLGVDMPALAELQAMVSPEQLQEAISHTPEKATGKEKEKKPEEEIVVCQPKSTALVLHSPPKASPKPRNMFDLNSGDPFKNTAGVPVVDEELKMLFDTYDSDGSGFIDREEFKNEYRSFENFGLEMTDKELDNLFDRYDFQGKKDGKLSFPEFAMLMLRRSKM